MSSLFKSESGKQAIFQLYDEKLESLNIDYAYQTVNTSFGATNLIVTGNPENPPLIIVHGSNGCAPIALETWPNLAKAYQVFAVDVLAQPNKSTETRLSMQDDAYGKWMNEIIHQLNLEAVTMAGFSFGRLVILKTLEFDESKIKEVYLSSPAYIVNGNPLQLLLRVFLPMKRFMKSQRPELVEKFLSSVFTAPDPFALAYLSKVFLEFEMDFTPVPVIDTRKAKRISTPITIFAAQNDLMFPGKKMLKRASRIFPSLKESTLIAGAKHVLNAAQNQLLEQTMMP